MKVNFFDNSKKKIKKLLLTGAIVATSVLPMAGCGFLPSISEIYEVYKEVEEGSTNYTNNTTTSTNTTSTTIQNEVYEGDSFNKYLYPMQGGNLNDVVMTNPASYSESKPTNNADRRLTEGEYVEQIITLPEEECNEFVKWVRNQDVVYVYADLYDVDLALNTQDKYYNDNNKYGELICDITKIPSQELIYNTIKTNNINTLSQNSGYQTLPDEEINLIAQLLHEDIKLILDKVSQEDLQRIYSMLNDISAVSIDSYDFQANDLNQPYNARVLENGTIIIDLNNIGKLKDEQAKIKTYDHEIMHLFQRMCPDNQITGYYQIGASQYFDELEINPLHWNAYYEAGAELSVMNKYNTTTPLVYKTMVGYLKSYDLVNLLQPEYEQTIIEDSTFITDPNKIFEIFGAETEEEKKEIIYMLFSTDVVQTAREDFLNAYKKEYNNQDPNIDSIKFEMKKSICQTLSKYFYINLAEQLKTGQISLQDVFYLINVWEADLSYHTDYDMVEKYEYNKEFIQKYTNLQNEFFKYIAENNNMTYEEVVTLFGDYSMIIKDGNVLSRNSDLDWLTQGEREFIYNLNNTNLWAMTYNIRDIENVLTGTYSLGNS